MSPARARSPAYPRASASSPRRKRRDCGHGPWGPRPAPPTPPLLLTDEVVGDWLEFVAPSCAARVMRSCRLFKLTKWKKKEPPYSPACEGLAHGIYDHGSLLRSDPIGKKLSGNYFPLSSPELDNLPAVLYCFNASTILLSPISDAKSNADSPSLLSISRFAP